MTRDFVIEWAPRERPLRKSSSGHEEDDLAVLRRSSAVDDSLPGADRRRAGDARAGGRSHRRRTVERGRRRLAEQRRHRHRPQPGQPRRVFHDRRRMGLAGEHADNHHGRRDHARHRHLYPTGRQPDGGAQPGRRACRQRAVECGRRLAEWRRHCQRSHRGLRLHDQLQHHRRLGLAGEHPGHHLQQQRDDRHGGLPPDGGRLVQDAHPIVHDPVERLVHPLGREYPGRVHVGIVAGCTVNRVFSLRRPGREHRLAACAGPDRLLLRLHGHEQHRVRGYDGGLC